MGIQDAVKKVLVLMGEWKYPNFCGKFLAFSRNLLDKWYSYHYISLAPFIVLFYNFLFSTYLALTASHFLSDILVPFPGSSDFHSCVKSKRLELWIPIDCNGQGFIQALLLMLTWWKKIEFYKQKSNCEAIETAVWYLEKIHGRVSGGKAIFCLFNVFQVIK